MLGEGDKKLNISLSLKLGAHEKIIDINTHANIERHFKKGI